MKTKLLAGLTMLVVFWAYPAGSESVAYKAADDLKHQVLTILNNKCNVCHRTDNPGKVFTHENIETYSSQIYRQVFVKRRMPKGSLVKLTNEEETILRKWLQQQPNVKVKE
jgi:uncharacterized membrane protein